MSVPPVGKGVIRPPGADGLSAVGAAAPPDRLPAVADPVLVALGAGVPPRDTVRTSANGGCHLESIVWGKETFIYDVRTTGKRMNGEWV